MLSEELTQFDVFSRQEIQPEMSSVKMAAITFPP